MSKIKDRLKEPSTHAGIASIVSGVALILHSPETVTVAAQIPQVAEKIASQDYLGAAMIVFGSLAVLFKENK
jgi:hypothetical protein